MRKWPVRVSVIIPVGRDPDEAARAIDGVLGGSTRAEVELIAVGDSRVRDFAEKAKVVVEENLNPAVRRNRGAAVATGEMLAFIDDDARPAEGWIDRALDTIESSPEVVILGGPDPAPPESTVRELITDTLLAAPLFGSGVLAHQPPLRSPRRVTSPHDLALVNLFVRTATFRALGGFDESIGYVGEDSDLIARAMELGEVVYDPSVIVWHRRRRFPGGYLAQRFRYRRKTGRLLVQPRSIYRRNVKVIGFLVAAPSAVVVAVMSPVAGIGLAGLYVVGSLMSGVSVTRLGWPWWPVLPLAFAVHHATYLGGLIVGMAEGFWKRVSVAGAPAIDGSK